MLPSSFLSKKVEQLSGDPRELHILLRFCEEIRFLSRTDCYLYLDEYLPKDKLTQALINTSEFSQLSSLLLRLHKLHPKLAANVVADLLERNPDLIGQLIRNEPDIVRAGSDLFVLSKLNRRLAVLTAREIQSDLSKLVNAAEHYNEVAAELNQLSKSISLNFAKELCASVNRPIILDDFKRDLHRVSMVGRSLYNLAQVDAELGSWFVERLDYQDFTKDIQSRFIYNYTHLIRGFLVAADVQSERHTALLNQFLKDDVLISELNRVWKTRSNLTEISFFLSHLLGIPLKMRDILEIIGIDNVAVFRKEILEKFRLTNSTLHFTNGLFALAKIDLSTATEALDIYLQKVGANSNTVHSTSQPRASRLRRQAPLLPQEYQADDLTDMGCLLRVAAAIDSSRAKRLAGIIDIDRYVNFSIREANFGRLAVFILGLHEASRKLALEFTGKACTEEIWQKQYVENDILDNAIHYARSLGHVSRARGSQFIHFLLKQEKVKNDLYNLLEIQANLQLVSNWLRLLPMGGDDFVSEQVNRIADFLTSTADYDNRIRALLAATESLIECKELKHAEHFAVKVLEQEQQMKSVHKLHEWIDLFHKAERIGRTLKMPDFLKLLFARYKDWYFFPKILAPAEKHPLLLAYTFHLLCSGDDFTDLKTGLIQRQSQILKAIQDEPKSVVKAVALTLARASVEDLEELSNSVGWRYYWERGLALLTFSAVFPTVENPFIIKLDSHSADMPDALFQELNEDTGNLEFALTLLLAIASGISENLLKPFKDEAQIRAGDEVIGSIRWLLKQDYAAIQLQGHHYLWSIIKQSLLRQTYLSWENDLEEAVNNAAFELRQTRDIQALLA